MVRLGGGKPLNVKFRDEKFQFQYGAIGSTKSMFSMLCAYNFNASMVRLGARAFLLTVQSMGISIPVWCDWEAYKPEAITGTRNNFV